MRGSVWTSISTLIGTPVAFLANAVVARSLGVAEYGRLTVLTLTLTLAAQVTNFGVGDGVIRWGAAAHARGERANVDDLLRKSLGYHLLVQAPMLLIVIGALARNARPLEIVVLAISVVVPCALGSAALSISIENKTAGSAKLALLMGLLTQGAIAITAVSSHSTISVWSVRSVAGSVLMPMNFLLLDRARRRVALAPRLPRSMPVGFWRFAVVTVLANLVGSLVFARSEIYALELLGSASALGAFALAYGLSQQITGPVDAMIGPLFPAIAGLLAVEPERARQALLRAQRFASFLCATATSILIPAAFFLVEPVYGTGFGTAALLFVPLGLASCLQTLTRPVLSFTGARGRNDLFLRANTIALAVDVAAAFALIPTLGVWGAVIANVLGQSVALALVAGPELAHLGISRRIFVRTNTSWLMSCVIALFVIASVNPLPVSSWLRALAAALTSSTLLSLLMRTATNTLSSADIGAMLDNSPRALRPGIQGLLRVVAGVSRPAAGTDAAADARCGR